MPLVKNGSVKKAPDVDEPADTVRAPLALVAPAAATTKLIVPADSGDMPTTTFQPEAASPAMIRRPSFGVIVGVTPAGTFEMFDTRVPAAAFDVIERAFGERERVDAAADTVRVKIDDEALPPEPVANS